MLSAVILTKNEERNIEECLKSLSFCDDIIVIDDESTDNTVSIAKRLGADVYSRALESNFAEARNFALSKTKRKWVLFIDADERVPKDLANEITQIINDVTLPYSGLYIKRVDEMWGRKLVHGEPGSIKLMRLGLKEAGKWKRAVHEVWDIKGQTYTLTHPLIHKPHQTLHEFISDVDRMSTIHANANRNEKKRSNIFKILFWPPLKFLHNYFVKGGFRDGTPGFLVAAIMSFHSYLAWSKLWLTQRSGRK